jgi:D-aspartate ligase
MKATPAVVTPLDEHMGLDIARSLGRRGIKVFGIDPDSTAVGRKSKYCQLSVCPDPTESVADYVQFLVDWSRKMGEKPVLFPVSDTTALLCSMERAQLEPHFEFVMPDHATMVALSTKLDLATAAQKCGIPAPLTIKAENADQVRRVADEIDYPALLKPIESSFWHAPRISSLLRESALSGKAKVWLCHNAEELTQAYLQISALDERLIIQEAIPGPDASLLYISFYLDRQSRPLATFAGRKLRVLPIGFGSASYVRSVFDPALEELALKFLTEMRYQGLGGLEFKKDARDGQYKLIEFNARFGMWDGLGVRCGVDLPYIAYCDALRRPVETPPTYGTGTIWVDLQRDIRAFWMYRKRGQLTLRQWLGSLRGEKMWAIYSKNDWRPGLAFTSHLIKLLWTQIRSRRDRLQKQDIRDPGTEVIP